nr:MAG TPA: transcriptional repressor DicA [Caudoviricetes sp.]
MTIGDRIRAKRQDLGLSVDELAARLGKNRATVYRYENGDIENLPVGVLEPLATALETTPAYLIGLVDSAVPSTPSEPAITNNLPDKAKTALQQEDGKVAEIMELFVNLPADKQQEALNYLRYLSANANK